jgi:hypothetical protein
MSMGATPDHDKLVGILATYRDRTPVSGVVAVGAGSGPKPDRWRGHLTGPGEAAE